MKKLQDIWSNVGHTISAYSPFYQEQMIRLTQKYDSPNNWFILNWVRASEPEPFNLQEMAAIAGPYSTREATIARFDQFTKDGFLLEDAGGNLTLTDKGRGLIEGFFDSAHEALADVAPLLPEDMAQLTLLLGKLVEAAIDASKPTKKTSLLNSRWTDPGDGAPASVRIDQFVTDLYRYRDDVHLAAWGSYGVSGQAWETLTFVWRDDANTAAELGERLSFRGFTEGDYAAALEKLVIKGWIEEVDGRFQVTPNGKRIREEAEEKTDELFFASWTVLTEKELEQLDDLIQQLNDSLNRSGLEIAWDLASSVARGIIPVTRTAVLSLFEEHFEEPRFFFPTLLATGAEPEPYFIDQYVELNPYADPERLSKTLSEIAEAGLMDNGAGAYKVSNKGHEALTTVNDSFYKYLGELEILPDEDLQQLSDFLDRLVEASIAASEPADKPATAIVHKTHPQVEYPAMAKIDMQLDDLRAFRDDSHIAAWRPYGMSGRTWETLSFIWRGNAKTAAELSENLTFRGYEEDDYARSLKELAGKGLIKKGSEGFELTDKGIALRIEAEETTNRIFYEPWRVLEENEQTRLRNLLIRMKINLENLAEKVAETAGT
ncbi:MAG TPA: MarR family transcriptional regulator [candidate division Zixibacteria bacterium]|nr:MarR family transcriptional regulator [candidate division Zixibacteria bacterium]